MSMAMHMKKASFSKQKCLQLLIFLLLLACFCLQVKDSLIKFLGGKTTTAVGADKETSLGGLTLPSLTLCPGYRQEVSEWFIQKGVNPWPIISYFDSHPEDKGQTVSEEKVQAWWQSITFDLKDFVTLIEVKSTEEAKTFHLSHEDPFGNALPQQNLSVDEISGPLGRCYVLKSPAKFEFPSQFIRVEMNMSQLPWERLPAFYVAPAGAEVGLQLNYWLSDVIYSDLRSGVSALDVALRREDSQVKEKRWSWFHREQENCRNYDMEEWFKCSLDWERRTYLDGNCTNICSIPQAHIMTRTIHPPLPMCATEEDWTCAHFNYEAIYPEHVNVAKTGCLRPCETTRYTGELREDTTKNLGHPSNLYLYYHTTRVVTYEEYTLFDFNNIVAAVGGSLGLFLGFSCWQAAKGMFRKE